MKNFVDEHWRDFVSIYILTLGIGIALLSPESTLGVSLVMAGLYGLKLTTKTNGGTNVQP